LTSIRTEEAEHVTSDICVLVESTYPYVSGGVSSWLHALITNLPEFTFSVVHIGGRPDPERKPVFRLPSNVVELREVYIFDPSWARSYAGHKPGGKDQRAAWEDLRAFHHGLRRGLPHSDVEVLRTLGMSQEGGIPAAELFFAPESWELMVSLHEQHAQQSSLVNYLWMFRSTHLPIFSLLRAPLPSARVYHAVSSGFNGFAGVLARMRTGAPFILTEHGLATREREIEVSQAEWIYRGADEVTDLSQRFSHFQEWWLNMFRFMTKMSYDYADDIITIMGLNQHYQLRDGADARKMTIIPNGIDVSRFKPPAGAAADSREKEHFVVGSVGRIVAIKDIKTFIRAVQIARATIPNLKAYIVGPATEEPQYLRACQRLVEVLGLSEVVHFTGPADVRDYYRKLDVLVMTSMHEAQPLVILEGNCAGVPVVSTDVGAVRELLNGGTPEDQAIGPSGLITPPRSPQATADAIIQLWKDPELRRRMAAAGLERAERYYREENLYDAYRAVYRRHLATTPVALEG
jgi:glycosyltransferase involved in cell wall biosynthesis